METFADWSSTTFAPAKPYDPESDRTVLETLSDWGRRAATVPITGEDFGRVHDAAMRSGRWVDSLRSAEAARADWFATAGDRVKAATGIDLPNPNFEAAYATGGNPGVINMGGTEGPSRAELERSFFARVAELVPAHPELADITPDRAAAGQRDLALGAVAAAASAMADPAVNPLVKAAGSLTGSLFGELSTLDPATVASLFLPIGGKGATAVARIADAAFVQGVGGAVAAGAEQPAIQARRAELGLDHGLGPALGDVALGAAFGALGGGLFQGGGEALARLRGGGIPPADMPEVIAAARAEGAPVGDDLARALVRAAETDDATAAMIAARPEGMPEEVAARTLADGLRHLEDPSAPLPLVDPVLPAGIGDDLARRLVDEAPTPFDAVVALRETEGATLSALASPDPATRDLGRIATLDPETLARIEAGEIGPLHAAIVAATTPDPQARAAAFAAIEEARPRTPAEARMVASDAVAAAAPNEAPPVPPPPVSARDGAAGLRDDVPLVRDDGTVAVVARADLGRVAERERWMGEVISACKT